MWFIFADLTPPISADLADKFRQTVILVSDRPTSVKKILFNKNILPWFFFSHKDKVQIGVIMIKYHHQLQQDQKKPKALYGVFLIEFNREVTFRDYGCTVS